jgi:hypothetical protein
MAQDRLQRREAIEAATSLHARLFEWMLQHHERLAGSLADRLMDWPGLAETLAAEGSTDWAGTPPSPETVRKIWLRVCRFVAARRRLDPAALRGFSSGTRSQAAAAETPSTEEALRELTPEEMDLIGPRWTGGGGLERHRPGRHGLRGGRGWSA